MADHNGLMSMNDPDELPPPVTHSSSTSLTRQLTRNDTLISIQSSDALHAGSASKTDLDTLEKSLSAQSGDPLLQKLKNDYSDFKSEPSLAFFHDAVSVSTFHMPSTRTICYPQRECVGSGITFSDCLDHLALALREGVDTECIRTCVISMQSGASKLYPFRKMFLTTAKSHRRKQEAPIKAILYLVGQEWNLSPAVMEFWGGLAGPTQGFPRIHRPSMFKERLKLDSPNEISRRLVWLAKAPEYRGRLRTYIFRPFTEPPEAFSADIVIGGNGIASRNVLILLSFDSGSKSWSDDYDDASLDWRNDTATADITLDILRSIRVLCSYVIEDTEQFAQSMDERIEDMTYEGRRRPSRSLLQYLLCLEDSCRISLLGLQDAATLIEDLSDATESKVPGTEQDLREWFEKSKDDIRYLQGELKTAHQRILDVRAMIKDQLELQNDHRTNLLTLLAAIYIPFSFISSFFGMNLKDPLWSKKGSPSPAPGVANRSTVANTVDSPSNVSVFNTDETNAIINAITGSGTHLFSFKDYWIVTLPVVAATIFLPLVVGPVFRYSVRKLLKNTAFIVPILMLLTIVASLATSLKDKFTAYTAVVLFPFGLTAVLLVIYASTAGKDQILWCGYAITYGTSLWIDTFVRDFRIIDTPKGPWFSGLIPPTYLLITHCGISDWRNIGPRLKVFTWKWVGLEQGAEKGLVRRAAPIILYHIFAIPYWVTVRDRGTLLAIPYAILVANRLLNTTRDSNPKRFLVWLGFLFIWMCSVAVDRSSAPSRFSGFCIAFFPMWALFAYQAYLDHKTRIHEALREKRRGRGTEKPELGRSDSLPTRPRRQTFDAPRAPLSAYSRRHTADLSSGH